MMFKTTRDLLDRVRSFHNILSEFYCQLADKSRNKRIKILLDYLSDHENCFTKNLEMFENEVPDSILDTWFKYVPDKNKLRGCEKMELASDMSVEDVVRLSHRVDDCLIQFYKEMAKHGVMKEIKELFTNLLQAGNGEKLVFSTNRKDTIDL